MVKWLKTIFDVHTDESALLSHIIFLHGKVIRNSQLYKHKWDISTETYKLKPVEYITESNVFVIMDIYEVCTMRIAIQSHAQMKYTDKAACIKVQEIYVSGYFVQSRDSMGSVPSAIISSFVYNLI